MAFPVPPGVLAASPEAPVALRPLAPGDLAVVRRWDGDPEILRLYGAPPSVLVGEASRCLLAIEARGRLVGLVGLVDVSWSRRAAELQVLVGDPADRGRGVGRKAVQAFLGYVLATTNLELIYARVLSRNARAVRCYESCGFRRAGVLRVRQDGRYATPPLPDDLLLMALERSPPPAGTAPAGPRPRSVLDTPGRRP